VRRIYLFGTRIYVAVPLARVNAANLNDNNKSVMGKHFPIPVVINGREKQSSEVGVEGNAYLNFSEKNRENIWMLLLIATD